MAPEPTRPIYVRMPPGLADKLDQAARRLGASKRDVLAALVNEHLDTDGKNLVLHPRGKRNEPDPQAWAETTDRPDRPGEEAERAGSTDAEAGPPGFGDAEAEQPQRSAEPRPPAGEVLNPAEVAALLRVDESDVIKLASAGDLPGRRIGDHWRFSRRSVLRWLTGDDPA